MGFKAHEGNEPDQTSWIIKCTFNSETATFVCHKPKFKNSMLVKKASVYSICEFEEDGLLLQIFPSDTLVSRNWKVTNVIKDPEIGNTLKG